jgi:hypothetical protein
MLIPIIPQERERAFIRERLNKPSDTRKRMTRLKGKFNEKNKTTSASGTSTLRT